MFLLFFHLVVVVVVFVVILKFTFFCFVVEFWFLVRLALLASGETRKLFRLLFDLIFSRVFFFLFVFFVVENIVYMFQPYNTIFCF